MEIREVQIFKYNELNGPAKQKAYKDWYDSYDTFLSGDDYFRAVSNFGDRFYCDPDWNYSVGSVGYCVANFDWEAYLENELGYAGDDNSWLAENRLAPDERQEVIDLWADLVNDAKDISQNWTVSDSWVDEIYRPLANASLGIAFDAGAVEEIFDECVWHIAKMAADDWENELSGESFEENYAYDMEFLEDGTRA